MDINDIVKMKVLVQILNKKESDSLRNYEFARLIREQLDINFIKQNDLTDANVVSYLRSLVVPIIEANPGIIVGEEEKMKRIREMQRQEIQNLTDEFKKMLEENGSISWHVITNSGNRVIVEQYNEIICITVFGANEKLEHAAFLSIEAAAEYIVMNH